MADETTRDVESESDLEYDLAHDASGVPAVEPPRDEESRIVVATETPGYAGDYSYDLSHDVPRS